MSNTDMYCGAGNVPKGKIRGTEEYCFNTSQVRYYGIKAISKDVLKAGKKKVMNLMKEQIKLTHIKGDFQVLARQYTRAKKVLEDERSTKTEKKKAQAQIDKFIKRRLPLKKQFEEQKALVIQLEEEDRIKREQEEKEERRKKRREEKEKAERKRKREETKKKREVEERRRTRVSGSKSQRTKSKK